MIDIETGSTNANAAIFSLAAVGFSPEISVRPEHSFYVEISHTSNKASNRAFSESTMEWWATLPHPAPDGSTSLLDALQSFLTWLPPRIEAVWANSPSFDLAILKHACAQFDLTWPYPFWCERDVRTLKALTFPTRSLGNNHNAYQDAVHQAILVCDAYSMLHLQQTPIANPWKYHDHRTENATPRNQHPHDHPIQH